MSQAVIHSKIDMDGAQVDRETKKAASAADAFAAKMKGVGGTLAAAFTVGAVVAWGNKVLETAGNIADLASQSGVTTDQFQALAAAGKDVGVSGEEIASTLNKIKNSQGEVSKGNQGLVDAYATLGISAKEVQGLGTAEVFELISKRFAEAGGSAEAYAAVNDILGAKAGPKLVEVMNQLASESLPGLTNSMKEAGRVMSDETIKQLDATGDAMGRLVDMANTAGASFATKFVGGLYIAGKAIKGFFTGDFEKEMADAREKLFGPGSGGIMSEEDARKAAIAAHEENVKQADAAAAVKARAEAIADKKDPEKKKALAEAAKADASRGDIAKGAIFANDSLRQIGAGALGNSESYTLMREQLAQTQLTVQALQQQVELSQQIAENTKSNGGLG